MIQAGALMWQFIRWSDELTFRTGFHLWLYVNSRSLVRKLKQLSSFKGSTGVKIAYYQCLF